MTFKLTDNEFKRISALVYSRSGINLHLGKKELVRARLAKRLRATGCKSFEAYYDYLTHDVGGLELVNMLDALTTNKTSFFREKNHFDYLEQQVFPGAAARRPARPKIRFWSAGCSSGEEPYSLAIAVLEYFRNRPVDAKILATDISTEILDRAERGVYPAHKVEDLPVTLLRRYFQKGFGKQAGFYRVKNNLRGMVVFKHHNLMEPGAFLEPFDVIMCRNVMIYFDKQTQENLVGRFFNCLRPGGFLFVGHAESLTGVTHAFDYVQPTLYRRPG